MLSVGTPWDLTQLIIRYVAVKTFHFLIAESAVTLPTRKCVKAHMLLWPSETKVIEIGCLTQTQSMAVRGLLSSLVVLLSTTLVIAHGE